MRVGVHGLHNALAMVVAICGCTNFGCRRPPLVPYDFGHSLPFPFMGLYFPRMATTQNLTDFPMWTGSCIDMKYCFMRNPKVARSIIAFIRRSFVCSHGSLTAFGHFLLGSHNYMVTALGLLVMWPLAYVRILVEHQLCQPSHPLLQLYTLNYVISTPIISLTLQYPETLGNGCS